MRLSTFLSTQPCVSGKDHNYFSRAAILGHRPGSNPQPIELCADIGQVHLMLIWGWLGRTLVIITNGQLSADIKWSFKVRTRATRPQTILKSAWLPSSLDYRTRHGSQSQTRSMMSLDCAASISRKYFYQEISRKKLFFREIIKKFEKKIQIQFFFFLYFWYFDY
jgi:hypothetical protein